MVNCHVEDEPGLREDVEDGEQQPGQQQLGHLAPQTEVTAVREGSKVIGDTEVIGFTWQAWRGRGCT